MDNIDVTRIIEAYQSAQTLYRLHNGGEVIGHEVDGDNRLIYVIRDASGSIRLSYASDEEPVIVLPHPQSHSVTVVAGNSSSSVDNPST